MSLHQATKLKTLADRLESIKLQLHAIKEYTSNPDFESTKINKSERMNGTPSRPRAWGLTPFLNRDLIIKPKFIHQCKVSIYIRRLSTDIYFNQVRDV